MLKHLLAATALVAITAPAFAETPMTYDALVEKAAAEEGELTWFVWYFEDRFRDFAQQFTDETGIDVIIPDGDHLANIDKLAAEASRETGDIDVLAYGFDRLPFINADLFQSLDDLPADDGRVHELAGIDGGNVAVAWWGNQTGIAYDPAKIAEEDLPQTPEDFAAFWQAHPGEMGFNYENGSSGPAFYMSMLGEIGDIDFTADHMTGDLDAGLAFFNEYADGYQITASNADSLTRLSNGEFSMVAAWEDHMAGLQVSGEIRDDLKFYIPEMGTFGGGNAVSVAANAPHPLAARAFVAWLSSPEIQTQLNQQFGTAPMNAAADDSAALVSMEMRARQIAWPADRAVRDQMEERFIEDVIQER